ncbi:MAG: MBOAT family protein [Treponema sp.]|jgi:D-alanyl-lipoteichoic acid acyltransferase DltB (MBOAT superfamily)|nr:MBOAT family protein [Treponema sp.]
MLFNSVSFMIFLPVVFTLFWLIPHTRRWMVLLVASYYFYMSWNVKYIFLILFTTILSYLCALLMEKTASKRTKKLLMLLGVVLSLGILFFFKYFNFVSESLVYCLQAFSLPVHHLTLKVLLPVGISFYTFQTLSYVLDVYKGVIPAERHFGKYAVFVSFFPQLVAGPIERSKSLLPEIKKQHTCNCDNAVLGIKLIAWGFFKKLVIADNIAPYIDSVYNNLRMYSGFVLIFATVLFAFQIYCDFSGYSDIAIGVAKLFDISLMTNFKSPYFSASIKEFWTRWHISLSTWFRDYVYIPLGGNRTRHKRNVLITFLASGLWHGAHWTFVLWGGLHGISQIAEKVLPSPIKQKSSLPWLFRVVLVFFFVCFTWIFFRANTIADAFYIISHLFSGIENPKNYMLTAWPVPWKSNALKGCCGIVLLLCYDFVSLKADAWRSIQRYPLAIRYSIYFGLILIILLLRAADSQQFVYFQF